MSSFLNYPLSSFIIFLFHRIARQTCDPGRFEEQVFLSHALRQHTHSWNFSVASISLFVNSIKIFNASIFQELDLEIHKDDLNSSSQEFYRVVILQFSSVQSLWHVWLFGTPWIAARRASLSITNSRSSLKTHVHRVSDAIQPSHPLSSPSPPSPQSLPASESFPVSQLFAWGGQSTGVSALASFFPKKSQGWSSEWTGWISWW